MITVESRANECHIQKNKKKIEYKNNCVLSFVRDIKLRNKLNNNAQCVYGCVCVYVELFRSFMSLHLCSIYKFCMYKQ